MKLIIDIGNTRTKLASFSGKELTDLSVADSLSTDLIQNYLVKHGPFNAAIISSVVDIPPVIMQLLSNISSFVELNSTTPLPLRLAYETPESLGHDRIAAAAAAVSLFPGKNVLTIDAGTCITYDLTTAEKEYLGGGISPGIRMRFRAVHTFTGKLPLIEAKSYDGLIGRSTQTSILSGVMNGVAEEVKGIITRYRQEFPELIVVLTGGDHEFLVNQLKNSIFAVPELVLKGLNEILDYNETAGRR